MGTLADKIRQAGRVGIDTAPFIYYLEDHPRYLSLCDELFDLTNDDRLRKITEIEILVLERWLQEHGPTDINSEPQE